jgi:hypothetical protein
MPPLFKPSNYHKHLGVVNLVILFDQVEHLQQECDQVLGVVVAILLGENRTHSNARTVGLQSKWERVVREH